MKVLILSDIDSRLKWGLTFAFFLREHYQVDIYHKEKKIEQLSNYDLNAYQMIRYNDLLTLLQKGKIFLEYNIIFLSLGGGENIKFFYYLNYFFDKYGKRPLVVSGMNGLTDSNDIHALLCRMGSDIICINSLKNLNDFSKTLSLLGLLEQNLFYTGYVRLYDQSKICFNHQINTILFIEQTGIPKHIKQKKYLVEKILQYAQTYPYRKIIIKKRAILHKQHMNAHLEDDTIYNFFIKNHIKIPKNLIFDDRPIEILIYQADLCVSFYSTAIIEAIALGIKSIIIKDFGIGKSNENHHFIGSGLMISLNDWIEDKIPNVDLEWKKNNCKLLDKDTFLSLEKMIFNFQFFKLQKVNVYYNKKDFEYFYNFLHRSNKIKRMFHAFFSKISFGK